MRAERISGTSGQQPMCKDADGTGGSGETGRSQYLFTPFSTGDVDFIGRQLLEAKAGPPWSYTVTLNLAAAVRG